jgi:hypothetical protein
LTPRRGKRLNCAIARRWLKVIDLELYIRSSLAFFVIIISPPQKLRADVYLIGSIGAGRSHFSFIQDWFFSYVYNMYLISRVYIIDLFYKKRSKIWCAFCWML